MTGGFALRLEQLKNAISCRYQRSCSFAGQYDLLHLSPFLVQYSGGASRAQETPVAEKQLKC